MNTYRYLARVTALGLTSLLLSCAASSGCRKDSQGPHLVKLQGSQGKTMTVKVELAISPDDQERGLMYRQKMALDAGMLFIYPGEDMRHFWMKNTYIPLDMLFIGANQRIVGIVKNTEPMTTKRCEVDMPSRYVLEVNAGFVDKFGIVSGSQVVFENIPQADK